jgi:TctA family transporter
MHFTRFAAVLLSASLASAAAIHRRIISADTIIQDVNNINDGVLANREATEAYEGGNLVTTLVLGTPVGDQLTAPIAETVLLTLTPGPRYRWSDPHC